MCYNGGEEKLFYKEYKYTKYVYNFVYTYIEWIVYF